MPVWSPAAVKAPVALPLPMMLKSPELKVLVTLERKSTSP